MNREIKFRAWITDFEPFVMAYFSLKAAGRYDLADIPVMQFTGLKDKNGKEIYEGDIVRADWHWDGNVGHVIEWPDDVYDLREYCLDGNNIEVIGNIYEHGHLLK